MATQSTGLRDVGRKRKNNEDFFITYEPTQAEEIRQSGSLYLVADGVGGAAKGERASQFTAEKVLYEYYQRVELEPLERLEEILKEVNDDIYAHAESNQTRMASTVVAAVVREGMLFLANAGDSRAYLIRDQQVQQLTNDHNLVGELIKNGDMTEEEALHSKVKNTLTRSIGGNPEVHVETYAPIPLRDGDRVILCSDGITRYALRGDISQLAGTGSTEEIAQRMAQFANAKGGEDNISVVAVIYKATALETPHEKQSRPIKVERYETWVTNNPNLTTGRKRRALTSRGMGRKRSSATWAFGILGGAIILGLLGMGAMFYWVLSPGGVDPAATATIDATAIQVLVEGTTTTIAMYATQTAVAAMQIPATTAATEVQVPATITSAPPAASNTPEGMVPTLTATSAVSATLVGGGERYCAVKVGEGSNISYVYGDMKQPAPLTEVELCIITEPFCKATVSKNILITVHAYDWVVFREVDQQTCESKNNVPGTRGIIIETKWISNQ